MKTGGPRIVGRLAASLLLQEARTPSTLFWVLLFPAFLFVLFGCLFGEASFRIGIDASLEGSMEMAILRRSLEEDASMAVEVLPAPEGRTRLAEGRLHAFVLREAGASVLTVLVTEKDKPFGLVLSSLIDRAGTRMLRGLLPGAPASLFRMEVLEVNGHRLTYLYFLFCGTLGLSVMLNSFFAIPQTIIGYRRLGFLKRFSCTPLRRIHFALAIVLQRMFLGLVQVGLLASVAAVAFGLRFTVSLAAFLPVFLLGTGLFAAAGFLLAGLLSTVEAAVAVAQILTMLFLFTSGLFLPVETIPEAFSRIALVNPLWYFSRAAFASLVLGSGPAAIAGDLAALGAFFGALLALTAATFRWDRIP